ncbi:hypothetical protein TYRP_011764 [Tyrophagus putrescentiae]|nr:hypothetical protein TYRP_011764 [Tyrophagus putrescentiae]
MRPIFSMTKSGNLLGLMMFLFCFVLLITASQQQDGNSHLGDGNVDANSIASDLKSGNRGVFAVGYVSDKLTLFVSGPGSGNHKNPSGGFQVAVEEATDGVFKISSAPVPVPSGIPSNADVKFVCKDSSGDNLVAMSNIGSTNAYLFDDSKHVYVFEASVFTSKQSAKLTKKSKEEAFVGTSQAKHNNCSQETTSQSKVLLFSLIFIVVTIVLAIIIPLICCYYKPIAELWQKKKKSQSPKSSRKSTKKGGTSGRHVKGGSTSSPKKMAATSDRSKTKSKSKAASPQSKPVKSSKQPAAESSKQQPPVESSSADDPDYYYKEKFEEDPKFLKLHDYHWKQLFVDMTKTDEFKEMEEGHEKEMFRNAEKERRLMADDFWARGYEPFMSIRANTYHGRMYPVYVKRTGIGCTDIAPDFSIAEAVVRDGKVLYGETIDENGGFWAPFEQQPPPLSEVKNPIKLTDLEWDPETYELIMERDFTPLTVKVLTEAEKEAIRKRFPPPPGSVPVHRKPPTTAGKTAAAAKATTTTTKAATPAPVAVKVSSVKRKTKKKTKTPKKTKRSTSVAASTAAKRRSHKLPGKKGSKGKQSVAATSKKNKRKSKGKHRLAGRKGSSKGGVGGGGHQAKAASSSKKSSRK